MKAADQKAGDQHSAGSAPKGDPAGESEAGAGAGDADIENVYRQRLRECTQGVSVAAFARRADVPDSTLRSYVDGSSLPNWETAVKIARAAGKSLDWFAGSIEVSPLRTEQSGAAYQNTADFVLLPLYDVRASAGQGPWDDEERMVRTLAFSRQWLTSELRANADATVLIYVDGDSMEPTLRSGDIVMVDRSQSQLSSDGMYVFTHDGALLIKRLQRLAGGAVRVISDNPRFREYNLQIADFEGDTNGSLSIGGFVLANIYMLQMVRPLETLGMALRDVSQAVGFVRPLLDVLREQPEEPRERSQSTGGGAAVPAAALSFRNVSFGYHEDHAVLRNLNLDIPAGRTVAIVGSTGAGKSSLVRLLLRLYEPQRGSILLDDTPTSEIPVRYLRSVVGLVPQDTILFNDTIAHNICVGKAGASLNEIEHAARLAHLHDFISSLPRGYDTLVGERGLKLSGGERQRIAIARAVIKRPRLYVFDEATSSLDSRTEAEVLRNLREVSAGSTTLVIAHRLSTVLHADEIVVLDDGHVTERGTHAALLERGGAYARLWHAQMPKLAA